MKTYNHDWNDVHFILHLEFKREVGPMGPINVRRDLGGADDPEERIDPGPDIETHRILVSRTHPKETRFQVTYPDGVLLQVFALEDRAYYPVEPCFVG
jgi:hypothetical protein